MRRTTGDVIVIPLRSSPWVASIRRSSWFCYSTKLAIISTGMWLSDGSKAGRALTFRPESARSVLMRSFPKNRGSSGMLLFLANALTQDLASRRSTTACSRFTVLPMFQVAHGVVPLAVELG